MRVWSLIMLLVRGTWLGRATGHALTLGLALVGVMTDSAAGAEAQRVLMVHSFGSTAPPFTTGSTAFETALTREMGNNVDLAEVSLDMARYAEPDLEEPFVDFLLKRLAKWQPDLVVPIGAPAGLFVAKYQHRLFPKTPIVYTGMDRRTVPPYAVQKYATFVGEEFKPTDVVENILQVKPDTNNIVMVLGASPLERYWTAEIRRALVPFANRVSFTWVNDLTFDQMLELVANLPPRSSVLLLLLLRDAAGVTHNEDTALQRLRGVAHVPIYGIYQHQLGLGIVGGRLHQAETQGVEAARVAVRILRGEPVWTIPSLMVAPLGPRYDWRELRRWNISEARLPPGSVVLFRQPTLWQQYRWYVLTTVGLIAAQTALIGALLVQRRRRREAQAALTERLRFEVLVSEVVTACATATPDQLDERIRDGLRRVGMFLGVDRGTLWQRTRETSLLTHAWERSGAAAPRLMFEFWRFPYLGARMEAGDVVCFTSPDDLPPEAASERAESKTMGVRSYVAIPLRAGDRLLGVLVFLSLHAERQWPVHIVQQLRTLAEPFATALIRLHSAAAVEHSAAMAGAVLAALPGETAIIDSAGTIVKTNEAWATAARSGAAAQLALKIGANYLDACRNAIDMPPDTARTLGASVESILRGQRDEFAAEYQTSRHGSDRWFEVRVRRLAHLGGGAAIMHLDVTARRQAEAAAQLNLGHLAHLDRVAAMGHLASSIAHELNQPLAGILANAQAAKLLLSDSEFDLDELRACLADIVSDDKRATEVIRRMRKMLTKTESVRMPVALNDLTSNTIRLVASEALRHSVTIEFLRADALPAVYGDTVQIQQVILNLLTNAINAAAQRDAATPKVTVWTAAAAGPYVELGVHDSGNGIAQADLARIFEPFFTTKPDGLGMGLTISHAIVESHGGRIVVENDPAGGATFRIHLRTDQAGPT
jgi:signal transduction histidine kinase